MDNEVALTGGGSTSVHRRGDVVLRTARPWSATVLSLLVYLRERGFVYGPLPVGDGFSNDGREKLTHLEGDAAPTCWNEPAIHRVGAILRQLHDASINFATERAMWMPWWGRSLPTKDPVIGHCDAAPWNFLTHSDHPVALIDWDSAGPVGREWDVAQTAWLNAQLHDDDVQEYSRLPNLAERVRLLAAFCDGYRLASAERRHLVSNMIEIALRTSAQEAIDAGVSPSGVSPRTMALLGGGSPLSGHELLWAVTWRVRSARWMAEHRRELEQGI